MIYKAFLVKIRYLTNQTLPQIYQFNIFRIGVGLPEQEDMMQNSNNNEEFKKQALQFILSIYLQRQNDQDIQFMRQNVKTSVQFAKNVSSSIKNGLSQENVQKNKLMYGKNSKIVINKFSLRDIILKVIKLHNVLVFCISIIQIIFGAVLEKKQIYMDALYVLVLLGFVLLIRVVTIYLYQKKKSEESYEKNKKQKYRILRDGNYKEVPQTKIIVGDIVQLDYKQKAPASGILITNKQITMNQEKFGRRVQRKMCIQKCIGYVDKLSILQLKIQAQKTTLPSPIILRGTQQIYGSTFRLLVLAVNEQNLLDKHKVPEDPTFVSDVIREWFKNLQGKIQKIMKVISVTYTVLFVCLFGLKQFLQRDNLSGQMFITDLFSVLLMSILGFSVFDTNCLRLFFQTQVIRYTQNLNNPKQVDKYLTVQQIYISEDNIVKYDQIIICEVGIADKQHAIQYQDLNILADSTRTKIEEILEGVGLEQKYKQRLQNDILKMKQDSSRTGQGNHQSQIIHLNTVDQKIFSSLLYSRSDQDDSQNVDKYKQEPMFSNTHQQQNASDISLNRIKPLNEDGLSNGRSKNTIFRKRKKISSKRSQTQNQQHLKGYLGQHCRFKTQNIVQSIVQLAKQQSRTYYYQKYTINRLKKIPFIYSNGVELQMNKDKTEKTKRLARAIRLNQTLTPFLIGYSDGAYNNNSMKVLVAVVGVRINYQNEIIQRIKQLSTLGINTIVLIHKREDEDRNATKQNFLLNSKLTSDFHQQQDYNKIILTQYINRGWITHQAQQMIDFPSLKEAGGTIRCESCFLSFCDCKDKVQQLSNIQGFMSCSQNTRIIHSIDSQPDIHYLVVGSEQIRNSVILITKYKSDTIKVLENIKRGYYLSNILERGLNVWYGFMFVSAMCFYPLTLISFGGVLSSGDLSLWNLFIQSLPAIANMDISIERKQKTQNSSRRNKVLYSKKSTLSVFFLCLISTVVATVFYIKPTLIIEQSFDKIAKQIQESSSLNFARDCKFKSSIFLSNQFNKIECSTPPQGKYSDGTQNYNLQKVPHFIYSQNVSFIFSYLCLNMLIFLIINFKNFTKPKVLAVYVSVLGVYFIVIYGVPDLIHGRSDGLTPGQLAIVFGMSILTNLVIQFFAYSSNYSCRVCDTEQFQSVLTFQQNIQQHYSSKLKKYNNFQTQIYTLN